MVALKNRSLKVFEFILIAPTIDRADRDTVGKDTLHYLCPFLKYCNHILLDIEIFKYILRRELHFGLPVPARGSFWSFPGSLAGGMIRVM